MITPIHAVLPVPGDQALNALADRKFLAQCVPEIDLDAGGGDLLRGVITAGSAAPSDEYQVALRLVDFDPDCGTLRYEAQAREVEGQGLASLIMDMDIQTAGEAAELVLKPRLATTGITGHSLSAIEYAVSERLSEFGAKVVAVLGEEPGRIWRSPGADSAVVAVPAVEGATPEENSKPALDSRMKIVIAVLGTFGGAALLSYLLRHGVRAGRVRGAQS
ncbi:hypothetical protein L618_002900000420 [Rhodococcus rhodochrous J45]|uniref:Carbon monoxide dehydrogenase subunit G n=1 Tax=Rhodococcus rhodochrous J45 TaxID=935266 RepID=A0A562E2E1_RHORH|nr:hypothetical protein [Rhodococcus rhodochrous]TWH16106.1 hypothetical protein L618_002900000420 [Rhodococcus rhodochrous J45]